jgi:hypothetical protein
MIHVPHLNKLRLFQSTPLAQHTFLRFAPTSCIPFHKRGRFNCEDFRPIITYIHKSSDGESETNLSGLA